MSAMATVVSVDLACVILSIAGVGNHLRFLVTTPKALSSYCAEYEPQTRLVLYGRDDDGLLLGLLF